MKTYPRVKELLQEDVRKLGSVNQVAMKTGLTNNTIGKYLEGMAEPKCDTLKKLAKTYGTTEAWLRGDSDNLAPAESTSDVLDISGLDQDTRDALAFLSKQPSRIIKKIPALLALIEKGE